VGVVDIGRGRVHDHCLFSLRGTTGKRSGSPVDFRAVSADALPKASRRHLKGRPFDEREREIADKALLASFRASWAVFVGLVLITGFVKGWDTTLSLPMWILSETLWWSAMLVMAVQSATTLVLYRRGAMPSEKTEIRNYIRRLRFEHGEMTQDDLAKQAGVTRHTIMALEAGKYFPSLLLAFRIARRLVWEWTRCSSMWRHSPGPVVLNPVERLEDFPSGVVHGDGPSVRAAHGAIRSGQRAQQPFHLGEIQPHIDLDGGPAGDGSADVRRRSSSDAERISFSAISRISNRMRSRSCGPRSPAPL